MATPNNKPAHCRRRDLDAVRELIVCSIIFFHTARIFDQFDFYIKDEAREPAVTLVVILTAFWGMPLMFAIAGFAVWHSLQKRSVTQFTVERLRRLFIPLVMGLLVIVPPQVYFRLCVNPGYQQSYAQFYQRFFDVQFHMDFPRFFSASPDGYFTLAHLWFIYVLLLFTLFLLPVFLYLQKPSGQRLIGRLADGLQRPWTICLPALPIATIEAGLGTDMSGGWNQSVYLIFICYGYLLAADGRFACMLGKYWKSCLAWAVFGSIFAFIALFVLVDWNQSDPLHAYDPVSVLLRFFKGIIGWSWLAAIVGYLEYTRAKPLNINKQYRTLPDRLERYANEAVMPFYLLHQTIIVIIAFHVVPWNIHAIFKFLIISLCTLATTFFLHEIIIKRTRLTRYCFGMKPINGR